MAWGDDALARQVGGSQQFYQQQNPTAAMAMYNYGRGSESDYGNQADIMGRLRGFSGAPSYTDPFNSYGGFQEFSQTGGYSPTDIANMRARGVSPIRAAYAGAQRQIGQQRSLQGGYAPNAIAARVKMAREQGQGMADATQNVEAGLAQARNQGRLAGLSGMSGIEGQRLQAQLASRAQQLDALKGMTSLYGTSPGMAQTFGNQAIASTGQLGNYNIGLMGQYNNLNQGPGNLDRILSGVQTAGNVLYPWLGGWRPNQGGTWGNNGTFQGNTTFSGNAMPDYGDIQDPGWYPTGGGGQTYEPGPTYGEG
jgi:hypothetical protein